jgi:hypothetical protein
MAIIPILYASTLLVLHAKDREIGPYYQQLYATYFVIITFLAIRFIIAGNNLLKQINAYSEELYL